MQIKNKELAFLSLCGDWDYRKNVDMTEPHLQGIAIRDNKILISYFFYNFNKLNEQKINNLMYLKNIY